MKDDIKNYLKEKKLISKGLKGLKNNPVTQELIGKIPVPFLGGIINYLGDEGIKKVEDSGYGVKDDIINLGSDINSWLKKSKGISGMFDFIKQHHLTKDLLSRIPYGKEVGTYGLQKLSNYIKSKGYGFDINDEIDYYLLPRNSNEKIGFGLKGVYGTVEDQKQRIYEILMERIKKLQDKQDKMVEEKQQKVNKKRDQIEQIQIKEEKKVDEWYEKNKYTKGGKLKKKEPIKKEPKKRQEKKKN